MQGEGLGITVATLGESGVQLPAVIPEIGLPHELMEYIRGGAAEILDPKISQETKYQLLGELFPKVLDKYHSEILGEKKSNEKDRKKGEWLTRLKQLLDFCGYTLNPDFEREFLDETITDLNGFSIEGGSISVMKKDKGFLHRLKKTSTASVMYIFRVKEGFIENRPKPPVITHNHPKAGE